MARRSASSVSSSYRSVSRERTAAGKSGKVLDGWSSSASHSRNVPSPAENSVVVSHAHSGTRSVRAEISMTDQDGDQIDAARYSSSGCTFSPPCVAMVTTTFGRPRSRMRSAKFSVLDCSSPWYDYGPGEHGASRSRTTASSPAPGSGATAHRAQHGSIRALVLVEVRHRRQRDARPCRAAGHPRRPLFPPRQRHAQLMRAAGVDVPGLDRGSV